MIFFVLFLFCLALGVFIYIKHKQTEREIHKKERLEEKQEQLLEILRKREEEK